MGYFPSLNIGIKNEYIYYKSLLNHGNEKYQEIGQQVSDFLNSGLMNEIRSGNPSKNGVIYKSLLFIKQLAELEEKKEKAWLESAKKMLRIPSSEIQIKDVITELNKTIYENEHYLKNVLKIEIDRQEGLLNTHFQELKKQVNDSQNLSEFNEKNKILQNAIKPYRQLPERVIGNLAVSISNYYKSARKTYGKEIANMIANKLFEKDKELDEQWLNKVNAAAQQIALEIIVNDNSFINSNTKYKIKAFDEWLSKEENISKIKKYAYSNLSYLYAHESLTHQTNEISKDEAYILAKKEIEKKDKLIKQRFLEIQNQDGKNRRTIRGDKLKQEFQKYKDEQLADLAEQIYKISKNTVKIVNFSFSEQIVAKDLAILGIKKTLRPKNNPKEDTISTFITYDVQYLSKGQQEGIAKIVNKYEGNINQKLTELISTQSKSPQQYHKALDELESFSKENLNTLYELQKKLEQKNNDIKFILTQYDILTSVKMQDTTATYKDTATDNEIFKYIEGAGFKAGSLGANDSALDVLETIINIAKLGNIRLTQRTINWLKMSLLNSGHGLLGSANKGVLENYFAIFISLLMFSDAEQNVQKMINNYAKNTKKLVSVQRVHLLKFNQLYIPLSTLLNRIYNELYDLLSRAGLFNTAKQKNSVRVYIKSYDVHGKNPGGKQEDWQRESELAKQNTTVKVFFLSNFNELLKQIDRQLK